MANSELLIRSLITRAGGVCEFFDPNLSVEKQMAWVDDLIVKGDIDAILFFPVQEEAMVTSAERAEAAGIPVYNYGIDIPSTQIHLHSRRDTLGEYGTNVVGQYYVKLAEETGNQINVYELWGQREVQDSVYRHQAFHRVVDQCPLITVTESPDSMWSADISSSLVMDAFTAYPELNAIFAHGGDSAPGGIEGLRAIDRLYPAGHPDHVIVATNDVDDLFIRKMDEGFADACGTHSMPDLDQGPICLMINNIILGQPIPKEFFPPMYLLTSENYERMYVYGVLAAWPKLPQDHDLWPVMDMREFGSAFEIPTKERRMELVGY
jgi:ABC-type sugar transport system substrate-binding protein